MQTPPDMMPDRFGIVGLAVLGESGDFPSQDIGDRAAIAPDRVGVAYAFGAIGIADAASDEFECLDLAMRAVGERDGERDAVEFGLDRLDACHSVSIPAFLCMLSRWRRPGNRPSSRDHSGSRTCRRPFRRGMLQARWCNMFR